MKYHTAKQITKTMTRPILAGLMSVSALTASTLTHSTQAQSVPSQAYPQPSRQVWPIESSLPQSYPRISPPSVLPQTSRIVPQPYYPTTNSNLQVLRGPHVIGIAPVFSNGPIAGSVRTVQLPVSKTGPQVVIDGKVYPSDVLKCPTCRERLGLAPLPLGSEVILGDHSDEQVAGNPNPPVSSPVPTVPGVEIQPESIPATKILPSQPITPPQSAGQPSQRSPEEIIPQAEVIQPESIPAIVDQVEASQSTEILQPTATAELEAQATPLQVEPQTRTLTASNHAGYGECCGTTIQ